MRGGITDITRGEWVEKELDVLIERRAAARRKEGELTASQQAATWRAELYAESVRRYNEQRLLQARLEWHRYHAGQAERHRRTLERLIAHHEEQAQRLLEANGQKGEEDAG